jgi:hypothetical protein
MPPASSVVMPGIAPNAVFQVNHRLADMQFRQVADQVSGLMVRRES